MKPKVRLIILLGIIAALGPLSIDLYLSGFPEIAKDLDTPINHVSLSLTAYFIGIAIGQLINGPLLDRFGRKKPILFGFALYMIAALGCAFAPDINSLIALRFVMALGGSVGMVATRAVIRDHFEHNEIARALSAIILVFGIAPVLAPSIGSFVLNVLGWRYNFVLLALYALLTSILTYYFLKDKYVPKADVSIAPRAIFRVYGSLFLNRQFLVYALGGCFGMMAMFAYIAGSPFVIREILAFDENQYAWIFGLVALCYIGASQVNMRLLKSSGMLELSKITSVLFALLGLGLLVQYILGIEHVYLFLINLGLFQAMLGFINPNLQGLAMEPFKNQAGAAAALLGALRMLFGTIASGYISIFHDESALPMVSLMVFSALALTAILWNPNWTRRNEISYE